MKKIILILFISNYTVAQPGSYDTTFNTDGIATYCQTNTFFSIDAAFQSSGKILCFGHSYLTNGVSLVRYNHNGNLDTTFGDNGFLANSVYSIFPPNRAYTPQSIAIQSDNKIVIMGLQESDTFGNGFWVARLLENGAVDTSFNLTGYLDLFFGTVQDRGRCLEIQSDGKIIVAGRSGNIGENFAMARLNANGTLDTSFGIGGKVQTTFFGSQSGANSILLQPDGKIILGGWTNNVPFGYDFALIRYNSNGSLDSTFGNDGKVITTVSSIYSDAISKIILQSDGKIIAGGNNQQSVGNYVLTRYLPNGNLDTSFGVNGIVIDSEFTSIYSDIAQQIDGKIILAGGWETGRVSYLRYLNNGQIDSTFPVNGAYANLGLLGYASTVLIQPDNKIIICGSLDTVIDEFGNGILCSGVVRLNPGVLLSNDEFEDNNFVVYPNPSNGIFKIKGFGSNTELFSINIYNVLGQKVKHFDVFLDKELDIDLSDSLSGTYFISFSNGFENITKTVIIK